MVYEVPTERANRPALAAGRRRAHYLAVYGRHRPAETPVRTAVSPSSLARRRSPARRAVRPGPDAGSRRPTAPQAAAAQMGCPVLGRIRAGHLVERAGIGDCLGMHQMPVLAVPCFPVGIGAQPSIPAALGATHRPHIDLVADLHHPDRNGPGGAV